MKRVLLSTFLLSAIVVSINASARSLDARSCPRIDICHITGFGGGYSCPMGAGAQEVGASVSTDLHGNVQSFLDVIQCDSLTPAPDLTASSAYAKAKALALKLKADGVCVTIVDHAANP